MNKNERNIIDLVERQTGIAAANIDPALTFADGTYIIDVLKAWNVQMRRLMTGTTKPEQISELEGMGQ